VLAFCYNSAPVQGCPVLTPQQQADIVMIDLAPERSLAGDSAALIDAIADKLSAGVISPALKAQARVVVDGIPASQTSLRVAEALYLISTSPELALQR
jgi:hypothetical protein